MVVLRLLLIGLALAVAADIDTVHIVGTMWGNPVTETVAAAVANAVPKTGVTFAQLDDATRTKVGEEIAKALSKSEAVTGTAQPSYAWKRWPANGEWPGKLLGWLLTAVATSFGAQFWFNLLSEALKLRRLAPSPGPGRPTTGRRHHPRRKARPGDAESRRLKRPSLSRSGGD